MLNAALDAADFDDPTLRHIASKCTDSNPRHRYNNMQEVHLALENRRNKSLYGIIIGFLIVMALLCLWLLSPYAPKPIGADVTQSQFFCRLIYIINFTNVISLRSPHIH